MRALIPLTPSLERLQLALADARGPDEVEGVHQVRVATRRLDAWLRLARRKTLRDDLAWLRRSASGVRDLDVLRTLPAAREIDAWLAALRERARGAMLVAWSAPRLDGLLEGLAVLPPLEGERAQRGLRRLRRSLRAAESVGAARGDLAALHRLRRALRRVRYATEWLGERLEPARELQDVLGSLNDLRLLRELCEREDAPRPARALLEPLEKELVRGAEHAHAAWRRERAEILQVAG